MSKRAVAGLLWFGAIWFGYEILWSISDVPRMVGPVIGAAVAAFVVVDPIRRFWDAPADRTQVAPGLLSSATR